MSLGRTNSPEVFETRRYVYDAIDSERKFQESLPRNLIKNQTPMEHLAILRKIIQRAEDHWYDVPGELSMEFMRKIAAVAVRCMEQHGAPRRMI